MNNPSIQECICKRCGKTLPPDHFHFTDRNRNGRCGTCRDCVNARQRDIYHRKNPHGRRQKFTHKSMQKRNAEIAMLAPNSVGPLDLERTCVRCGQRLPLDHFHTAKNNLQGRTWSCRDCANAYHRNLYREKYPIIHRRITGPIMTTQQWREAIAAGRLVCRRCGIEKPLAVFHHAVSHGRTSYHRDCNTCVSDMRRADPSHRQYMRMASRRFTLRKFGMNWEQFQTMQKNQDGCCAICGHPLGDKLITVDHDHISGTVRGLVHRHCNLAIGSAKEDLAVLLGGVFYLAHHHPKKVWSLLRHIFVPTTSQEN